MARKIGVTRHGLTRCPACEQHIKVADSIDNTVCPFCGAALRAPGPTPATTAAWRSTRGGLLTAALLAPALAACSADSTTGKADTGVDVSEQPDSSTSADVINTNDTLQPSDVQLVDDAAPQPEYGLPADVGEPNDTAQPHDVPVAPLYGLPPSDVSEPPPNDTTQPDDVPVAPLYGLPPSDVSEPPPSDTAGGDDLGPPAPMYGLPPSETP